MGYFQVVPGQVVGSDHMNTAIKQGVPPFASATARDTAIPVPVDGQLCWRTDTRVEEVYSQGAWKMLAAPASMVVLKLSAQTAALATGYNHLPCNTTALNTGTAMTPSGGYITINSSGDYLIGGVAGMMSVPAGSETSGHITVWRSGAALRYHSLGGGTLAQAIQFNTVAGSIVDTLAVGDQLRFTIYTAVAGTLGTIHSGIWARRI